MEENTIQIPAKLAASAQAALRDINMQLAGAAIALGADGWTLDLDAGVWRKPEPPKPAE